jgi:hypothetical protein
MAAAFDFRDLATTTTATTWNRPERIGLSMKCVDRF